MPMLDVPIKVDPDPEWPHFKMWERIDDIIYSIPAYFETELLIKGINVTEIFSVGGAFASVVENQVVDILNNLRNIWDPESEYADYAFVRQSQTFPDVLLRSLRDENEILFGIELKSWYVLSKEGEPSFRYQVTPDACATADFIVIIPWLLSEVISGTPKLLIPYKESARFAAEYRNYYWQNSRQERDENSDIQTPPEEYRHPYPSSKQESSDKAAADKGGNFGRIARAGILDTFVNKIKALDYLGIKIIHWIMFFKAISETSTDEQIGRRLQTLKAQIQTDMSESEKDRRSFEYKESFSDLVQQLEDLWQKSS